MDKIQSLLRDPDTQLQGPDELLGRRDLSVTQKLQVLRCWYADLIEDQKATEENMSGSTREPGATGARLAQVSAAIHRLENRDQSGNGQ